VATYEYQDAAGRVLYRVARLDPKGFLPQHINGTGTWESGYASDERVLYRLPALIAAPGRVVFVTEGERDADRLASLGLLATTNVGGSASWKKHASAYSEVFRGRVRAVVLVDNDAPGRKWAAEVAASLAGVDCPVVVIELPDLPVGGDVSDWLDAGHTVDELKTRVAASPQWTPPTAAERIAPLVGVLLSDVRPEAIRWLWPNRIARGKTTMIDGDPGVGKSALSVDAAARVSTGTPWPDGQPCPIGGVVILTGEDGLADTVVPRLHAAGGDATRVVALPVVGTDEHEPSIPDDLEYVEQAIQRVGALLLIVDPLVAFLGAETNTRIDHDVRRALRPIANLAERTGVGVLLIRHLNKTSGGPAIYRGGGSIGIIGAARIGLLVGLDPEDKDRSVLACLKTNIGPKPPALAYRLVEAANGTVRLAWEGGDCNLDAGQLLAAPRDDEARTAEDEAVDFLRSLLAGNTVTANDVKRDARDAGISYDTLRRAQRRLGIKPHKLGMSGPWVWTIPAEDVDVHEKVRTTERYTPSAPDPHLRASQPEDAAPGARVY